VNDSHRIAAGLRDEFCGPSADGSPASSPIDSSATGATSARSAIGM
jgi:hypothetical protein